MPNPALSSASRRLVVSLARSAVPSSSSSIPPLGAWHPAVRCLHGSATNSASYPASSSGGSTSKSAAGHDSTSFYSSSSSSSSTGSSSTAAATSHPRRTFVEQSSSCLPSSSNPSAAFPCVDANEERAERLRRQFARQGPELTPSSEVDDAVVEDGGPEPSYTKVVSGYEMFHYPHEFPLDYGGKLPSFDLAYETWGALSPAKDNVILLHTGLSASSHAASTASNPAKGWWEDFIGPNKPLDTNKFFVICTNVLGGCYGSTGPSSRDPLDPAGAAYATRFPILSIFDMVRAQFLLLDHLGIERLYASIGSSMGGMQSLAAAHLERDRVARVVSISGCARSAPASIALRYAQRSVLMSDPNWNRGFYYASGSLPPHTGMKLARQIATFTYRSGPEWEQRFGRARRIASSPSQQQGRRQQPAAHGSDETVDEELDPALCPDFLIETYLDHQGEQFCLKYDANSLIYISKAMDLFDMSDHALADVERRRTKAHGEDVGRGLAPSRREGEPIAPAPRPRARQHISTLSSPAAHAYVPALARGLARLHDMPTLVIGVQSDILFPVEQQREIAECLRLNGNDCVRYYEIDAPHGHDSFLIDVANVGGAIKGFLS
ncbi:Serine O-succinyltransferase [Thecaphora frezii]